MCLIFFTIDRVNLSYTWPKDVDKNKDINPRTKRSSEQALCCKQATRISSYISGGIHADLKKVECERTKPKLGEVTTCWYNVNQILDWVELRICLEFCIFNASNKVSLTNYKASFFWMKIICHIQAPISKPSLNLTHLV